MKRKLALILSVIMILTAVPVSLAEEAPVVNIANSEQKTETEVSVGTENEIKEEPQNGQPEAGNEENLTTEQTADAEETIDEGVADEIKDDPSDEQPGTEEEPSGETAEEEQPEAGNEENPTEESAAVEEQSCDETVSSEAVGDTVTGETDDLLSAAGTSKGSASPYGIYTMDIERDGEQRHYIVSGLTEENYESVLQQITDKNRAKDHDIVDAEKLLKEGTDSMLCWAASASNVLWTSGWGAQAVNPTTGEKFTSEDEIFAYFQKRFTDDTGNQYYGIEWFFNAIAITESKGISGWSKLRGHSKQDGVLKQYVSDLIEDKSWNVCDGLADTLKQLDKGDSLTMSVKWLDGYEGEVLGGHALTITGYSVDASGTPKSIIFTDSDNSVQLSGPYTDVTTRSNIMREYPLSYDENTNEWYIEMDNIGSVCAVIDEIISIKPYSKELAASVTETKGTRNVLTTVDLVLEDISAQLENDAADVRITTFKPGDSIQLTAMTLNQSYVQCRSMFDIQVDVYDTKKDKFITSFMMRCNKDLRLNSLDLSVDSILLSDYMDLKVGSYELRCTVNPEGYIHIKEAYYLNNNQMSYYFSILKKAAEKASKKTVRRTGIMLAGDNRCVCNTADLGDADIYGITAYTDANAFDALERRSEADGKTVWETVPETAYSIRGNDSKDSFRIELTGDYMSLLGAGTQTFGVTLNGSRYTIEINIA